MVQFAAIYYVMIDDDRFSPGFVNSFNSILINF